MSSDEKNNDEFVVKDKRRFDSDGNDRDSGPSSEAGGRSDAGAEQQASSLSSDTREAGSVVDPDEQIDFSSFIVSLATQAMVQLGVMAPPPGLEMPKNKEAARQTIDLISMLQDKTKGNLDPSEAKLMDDILHNLRMAFLQS